MVSKREQELEKLCTRMMRLSNEQQDIMDQQDNFWKFISIMCFVAGLLIANLTYLT